MVNVGNNINNDKGVKKLLLPLLLVSLIDLKAQNNKSQIDLSFGASAPFGEFASTASRYGGYAETGWNLQITYQYLINEHFGFYGSFSRMSNNFDTEAHKEKLNTFYGESWKINPTSWKISTILGGASFSYSVNPKIKLNGKAGLGMGFVSNPEIYAEQANANYILKQESIIAPTFACAFGVGADYSINDRWYVPINFDFMFSFVKFNDVKTTINNSSYSGVELVTFTQQIIIFNSAMGIGYRF